MQRIQMLRDQADLLRDLAKVDWDERAIRDRILELAEKCDRIADDGERMRAAQFVRRA